MVLTLLAPPVKPTSLRFKLIVLAALPSNVCTPPTTNPVPIVRGLVVVPMVSELKAFDPNSLNPTSLDPFIVSAVNSDP